MGNVERIDLSKMSFEFQEWVGPRSEFAATFVKLHELKLLLNPITAEESFIQACVVVGDYGDRRPVTSADIDAVRNLANISNVYTCLAHCAKFVVVAPMRQYFGDMY